MTSTQLLASARNALAAGLPDGCIDTAARVHADASASQTERAEAAILAARGMIAKGMWSDALVWCDQAGALDAQVATYRGWLHFQRDDKEAALADLSRAVAPDAPPIAAWYRAVVLDSVDRRKEAYVALGTLIEDPELGGSALRLRGNWRLEDGNRDEGIADLVAGATRGDTTSALRLFEEEALPDTPEAKLSYVRAIVSDDLDTANSEIDELLQRSDLAAPMRAKLLAQQALQANFGQDFEAAAEHYAAAFALAPNDRALAVDYGHALYNVDKNDEALAVFERARAVAGDAQLDARIDRLIGDIHFVAERRDKAVEHYERSLAACPRQPAIMSRCATSLDDIGRTDEARALRFAAAIAGEEQAIEACDSDDIELPGPLHDNGCFGLGNHGEPNRVAQTLGEAADLWLAESKAPGDFCARHAAMAFSNQSYALAKAERRDEAADAGRRAVELRPGFRDGWNNYGNQLIALGRFDDALAAFDRAAWCDPTYAGSHYGKSDALRRKGDGPGTVAALLRAAEIGYEDTERQRDIHFRLARAYHALGKLAESAEQWRRVSELEGDDESATSDALGYIMNIVAGGPAAHEPAPYRRYGMRPAIWYSSQTIAVRLQLATEPDEAMREKLTEAIEEHIGGIEEPKFTGRFIELAVEADPDGDFPTEAFEALEAAADAVHAISPLVEAVGYNAIGLGDEDDAETWSIATQPTPDAGPEPISHVAFWPFKFSAQA